MAEIKQSRQCILIVWKTFMDIIIKAKQRKGSS